MSLSRREGVVSSLPLILSAEPRKVVQTGVPFVIAPADRRRATGGTLDPSRCHGALVCFSFSCIVASLSLDFRAPDCFPVGPFAPSSYLPCAARLADDMKFLMTQGGPIGLCDGFDLLDDRPACGKCCGIGKVTIAGRQRNMRKGWNFILSCLVQAAINKMGNHRRLRHLTRADAKILGYQFAQIEKTPFIMNLLILRIINVIMSSSLMHPSE